MSRYRWDPLSPVPSRRAAGELRASDAERHAVGEALSRHYAEGRLDQAEFTVRLDRAMTATTRGDLDGLFVDLPRLDDPPPARGRGRSRSVALLLIAVLAVVALASSATAVRLPWLVVAVVVALLWDRARRRRRPSPAAVGTGR